MALCPGLPGWAGTREVKPIWILLKQRDSEWQWHQLGYMQLYTSLQTDNHASIPPLSFFTGQMPFLPPNQQRQSTNNRLIKKNHFSCKTTENQRERGRQLLTGKERWRLLSQRPLRYTWQHTAARCNMHVADVDGRFWFPFHAARATLAHTEDDDRQQTGSDDADDWQKCEGGSKVKATLNKLQVADRDTESTSRHLRHIHTHMGWLQVTQTGKTCHWQRHKQACGCLMHSVHLANALLKDEERARDNHVLACNFAKYSLI